MRPVPSFVPVLSVLGLALLAGCAHAPAPVAATATLAAAVEMAPPAAEEQAEPEVAPVPVAEPVKHKVEIRVDHLPPASSIQKDATTYVFWVRASEDDAWANATHLDPSSSAETTTFDFAQDVLFVHVTAEASTDVRTPSSTVVLSTRVSRNGACASGVDQHDVTMKVRMCH
jgi:hypothetical protein